MKETFDAVASAPISSAEPLVPASGPVRRALFGAAAGTFVEFYDFAVYGFTVSAIAPLFFPKHSATAAILLAFVIYGVGFVARPLGGIFFGTLGDRVGRKRTLTVVLTLVGGSTTVIGLLPTWATIGVLAPVLLCICRLVQGFSAGGEASGAMSFVLEHATPGRRGFYLTFVAAMAGLPSVFAIVITLGLNSWLGEEAFGQWGWRIPFLIALPMSMVALYIRNRTEESDSFRAVKEAGAVERNPLLSSIRHHWKEMLYVFAFCALASLGFYLIIGYFPTYLQTVAGLSRNSSLAVSCIATSLFTFVLPCCGLLSDRWGRRTVLIMGSALMTVVAVPGLLLVNQGSIAVAIAGMSLIVVAQALIQAGQFPFCVEIFPTATRYSGSAAAYNLGYAAFGGTAPIVSTFLVSTSGMSVAPGIYLAVISLLVLFVAFGAPESRDLEVSR
ncbi:MFS transporter [Nocardia xishanensis]